MTTERQHKIIRTRLQDVSSSEGLLWVTEGSVYPNNTRYSTIFMSAQREPEAWIYDRSRPVEDCPINKAGTSWCVRSDNFSRAGKSNRHLSSFEMLSVSGRMREDDAIAQVHTMILTATGIDPEQISAVTSEENFQSRQTLNDLGCKVVNSDTSFSRPDTNRTGHRVEFNVDFVVQGIRQCWELQNLVIITKVDGQRLNLPVIDSGGSFERAVSIFEKRSDVFASSLLQPYVNHITSLLSEKQTKNTRVAQKLADLLRTGSIMAQSGYQVGTKSRQEQTYRKLVREIGLVALQLEIPLQCLLSISEFIANDIKSWNVYNNHFPVKRDELCTSGMVKMLDKMYDNYSRISLRMNEGKNGTNLAQLAVDLSRKYDGGAENGLAQLALKKL